MKVKEIQGNIFHELRKINSDFIFDVDKMNRLFLYKYGERVLAEPVNKWSVAEIADILAFTYGDKWDNIINDFTGFSLFADKIVKEKEVIDSQETRKKLNEIVNKLSSFDGSELVVNDGSNTSDDDNIKNDTVKEKNTETGNIANFINNLQIKLENNIINTVLKDTKNLITLEIYE